MHHLFFLPQRIVFIFAVLFFINANFSQAAESCTCGTCEPAYRANFATTTMVVRQREEKNTQAAETPSNNTADTQIKRYLREGVAAKLAGDLVLAREKFTEAEKLGDKKATTLLASLPRSSSMPTSLEDMKKKLLEIMPSALSAPALGINECAAAFYRKLPPQAKTPKALYNLAISISERTPHPYTSEIFLMSEIQQYGVIALLYRRADIPFARHNLAQLIFENKINKDENGEEIRTEEDKYNAIERLYRKGAPNSLINLSILIEDKKINKDEHGKPITSEKQRCKAIAKLYRKAGTKEAMSGLATLIAKEKIDNDFSEKPIRPIERHEVAAKLYREAGTKEAMAGLALLIIEEKINNDFSGKPIRPIERYEVAAKLCREAGTKEAMFNLAALIVEEKANNYIIENGFLLENSNEIAAKLYREAKIPQALHNLAILIVTQRTDKDENGKEIAAGSENAVAIRLYKQAELPISFHNIGILYSNDPTTYRQAHAYFSKALEGGILSAGDRLIDLNEKMNKTKTEERKEFAEEEKAEETADTEEVAKIEEVAIREGAEKAEEAVTLEKAEETEAKAKTKAKEAEKAKNKVNSRNAYLKVLAKTPLEQAERKLLLIEEKPKGKKILWKKQAIKQFKDLEDQQQRKVIELIESIQEGTSLGHPEKLTGRPHLSRRITAKHRLVYLETSQNILITESSGHYN